MPLRLSSLNVTDLRNFFAVFLCSCALIAICDSNVDWNIKMFGAWSFCGLKLEVLSEKCKVVEKKLKFENWF